MMPKEKMTEDVSYIRRMRREQRARRTRRVRGCLLSIALMAALAVYAGGRAAHGPTENARSGPDSGAAQPLQASDPASNGREPDLPRTDGPEELFASEELEELVSGVLESIVSEDMTKMEQARAVFDYVHDNIYYTGSSDKSDWEAGACAGLTTGKGDCFTYYAVSRALLTALEIDNLPVERVGGETRHYWNLVDCGDGWYHFDACPRSSRLPAFLSFLFTDRQAADYTAGAGRCYYDFDGSLLPERATKILFPN
ncbi:MAG: hypothetical protein K2O45_10620 [Oscillospiraceae bacterium]|nr:hypothetical protein [Oscillospiraceae bacterium]